MPNIVRFFIRPNSPFWSIPKSQYQQTGVDSTHATPQERTLIANQYARNVVEARLLFKTYETDDPQKVIEAIGRRKPTVMERLKRGIKRFVSKLEGSQSNKPTFTDYRRGRL